MSNSQHVRPEDHTSLSSRISTEIPHCAPGLPSFAYPPSTYGMQSVLTAPSSFMYNSPIMSLGHNNMNMYPQSDNKVFNMPHGEQHSPLHTTKLPHLVNSTKSQKWNPLPTFSGKRSDWPEFKCVWPRLAEAQIGDRMQLAMELKRSCKGRAAERLEAIYNTREGAYEAMWQRLSEEYDDPALSIQEALGRLMSLKPVAEDNYPGFLKLVDTVEVIHNQLSELNQVQAVHAVDVDRVSANLPRSTQVEWLRINRDLSDQERVVPFPQFVSFLRKERLAVARLAENSHRWGAGNKDKPKTPRLGGEHRTSSHLGQGSNRAKCVMPNHVGHNTEDCRAFQALTLEKKYEVLKSAHICFNCFGSHHRSKCNLPPCSCGKYHHQLLCPLEKEHEEKGNPIDGEATDVKATNLANAWSRIEEHV